MQRSRWSLWCWPLASRCGLRCAAACRRSRETARAGPERSRHHRARCGRGADDTRASRRDLAFATGFAHGQDRYFQMDLMRRAAAGELRSCSAPRSSTPTRNFACTASDASPGKWCALRPTPIASCSTLTPLASTSRSPAADARPWEYFLLRATPRRVARRRLRAGRVLDVSQPQRFDRRGGTRARSAAQASCRRSSSPSCTPSARNGMRL